MRAAPGFRPLPLRRFVTLLLFTAAPACVTFPGFLPADAMLAALGDAHITIGEIAAIPGRMEGVASHGSAS